MTQGTCDIFVVRYYSCLIVPPTVKLSVIPANVFVQENDDLILTCSTTGLPSPNIFWSENGIEQRDWINMKTVTLKAVVRHNGTFKCVVNNTCGQDDDNVNVKVEG